MKKVYTVVFSLLLIFFIYKGAIIISDALPKLLYSFNYMLTTTSSSSSGTSLLIFSPPVPKSLS